MRWFMSWSAFLINQISVPQGPVFCCWMIDIRLLWSWWSILFYFWSPQLKDHRLMIRQISWDSGSRLGLFSLYGWEVPLKRFAFEDVKSFSLEEASALCWELFHASKLNRRLSSNRVAILWYPFRLKCMPSLRAYLTLCHGLMDPPIAALASQKAHPYSRLTCRWIK